MLTPKAIVGTKANILLKQFLCVVGILFRTTPCYSGNSRLVSISGGFKLSTEPTEAYHSCRELWAKADWGVFGLFGKLWCKGLCWGGCGWVRWWKVSLWGHLERRQRMMKLGIDQAGMWPVNLYISISWWTGPSLKDLKCMVGTSDPWLFCGAKLSMCLGPQSFVQSMFLCLKNDTNSKEILCTALFLLFDTLITWFLFVLWSNPCLQFFHLGTPFWPCLPKITPQSVYCEGPGNSWTSTCLARCSTGWEDTPNGGCFLEVCSFIKPTKKHSFGGATVCVNDIMILLKQWTTRIGDHKSFGLPFGPVTRQRRVSFSQIWSTEAAGCCCDSSVASEL